MSGSTIVMLCLYALGMACGQVLFKLAAMQANTDSTSAFIYSLVHNWYFILSVLLYGSLTVLWVWLLTRTPLSHAYPFAVLAFAVTPIFASLFLGERLDIWYGVGFSVILVGLIFLVVSIG